MKFSVVTVNKNNASGLERTIKSVISQRSDLFEYIVIDGKSTDNSLDIIKKYEKNINLYISEEDKSVYNAMNKSLQYINGEYVIFMNSGDEFYNSDVLSSVSELTIDKDFIFGGMVRVKNGKELSKSIPENKITLYTLFYRIICHQSTFTKSELLKSMGGYDESIKLSADWALLFDSLILGNKTYKTIPVHICKYDVSGMSSSKDAEEVIKNEKKMHFKKKLPYIYDDYVKMHSIYRFSLENIVRYIKWKLFD